MEKNDSCRFCGQKPPVLFLLQAKIRGRWSNISEPMDSEDRAKKSLSETLAGKAYDYRLLKFTAVVFAERTKEQ